jgi:Skp family chaperone for outer membrane proteins
MIGAIAAATGCKNDPNGALSTTSSNGATATVDIDKVARDLNWMAKLQTNLETYRAQLQSDLANFQKRYESEVQQHVKDMVPPGTPEGGKYTLSQTQSQELTNYIVQARQQVQQLQQLAEQQFASYRAQWIGQYRDALSPIVRQVAQDKRMNVVLLKNESVMFADRAVDITDAVVDAARAKPPALTEVPMSHLSGPPDIRLNQPPTLSTQPSSRPAPPTSQP